LRAAIRASIDLPTAAVERSIDRLAAPIESPVDAVAARIEPLGGADTASRFGTAGGAIQPVVCPIATAVEASVGAVAAAVEPLFDAIATPLGALARLRPDRAGGNQQRQTEPYCTTFHLRPPAPREWTVTANNAGRIDVVDGAKSPARAYVTMDGKIKGRGALSNRQGRFARYGRDPDPEALAAAAAEEGQPKKPETKLHIDRARTIIARNHSPDIPFRQSINPYRGCEHGCIYCYARASHSYLDLSPGRDFETQIFYKPNAVELLRAELAAPRYEVSPIALGTNTDPYQPVERELGVTRGILELLLERQHPATIVTKSALVLRDIDVLRSLAQLELVAVHVSLTTLDDELKRRMEPRTAGPRQRLGILRQLADAGIPAGVITAPIIPALNDHELESMLEAAAQHGASSAAYVLLRLPHEVEPLFIEWLHAHYEDRAEHVLSLLRQLRGGRLYESQFHSRQRGRGPFAALLEARFAKAVRRHGLDREVTLRTDRFVPPGAARPQLTLGF
jgi:DNA repair photolyase